MTQSPYRAREAESYEEDRAHERHWRRERDYVHELLRRRTPKYMLDAPVGTGRFASSCAPETRLVGIDLSISMLQVAKRRMALPVPARLLLARGSLAALPFSRGAFDLTLCCRFMHLIPASQLAPMFRELARVTAGRVCVQAYVKGPLHWRLQNRLRSLWRALRPDRSASRGSEPWSHIRAHFHTEAALLDAAARAGLCAVSATQLDRYNATRVMMYEWDSRP